MKIFWMFTRSKWGTTLCLLGLFTIFSSLFTSDIKEWLNDLPSFLFVAIIGLALLIPEWCYLFVPARMVWEKWTKLDESKHQQRRMVRAVIMELTPRTLERRFRCATFVGHKGGIYTTTLNGCTCPDFLERRVPCKHMYYLAMQLGLVDIPDRVLQTADRIDDSGKLPNYYSIDRYDSDQSGFDSESFSGWPRTPEEYIDNSRWAKALTSRDGEARGWACSLEEEFRTDEKIFEAVKSAGTIKRVQIYKLFPESAKSHIINRIDKMVDVGLLEKKKVQNLVILSVPEQCVSLSFKPRTTSRKMSP